MGDRERVLEALAKARTRLEEAVAGMTDDAWTAAVYENGWNAKQLLCHLVAGSPTGFIISMASKPPEGSGSGAAGGTVTFDIDAFNRAEVAKRQDRSIDELMDEARLASERDAELVQRTPEEILGRHYKAPWGVEGSVADVIITSLTGHTAQHLAELRTAIGGS